MKKRGIYLMLLSILGILTLLYAVNFNINELMLKVGFPSFMFVFVFVYGLSKFITDNFWTTQKSTFVNKRDIIADKQNPQFVKELKSRRKELLEHPERGIKLKDL